MFYFEQIGLIVNHFVFTVFSTHFIINKIKNAHDFPNFLLFSRSMNELDSPRFPDVANVTNVTRLLADLKIRFLRAGNGAWYFLSALSCFLLINILVRKIPSVCQRYFCSLLFRKWPAYALSIRSFLKYP